MKKLLKAIIAIAIAVALAVPMSADVKAETDTDSSSATITGFDVNLKEGYVFYDGAQSEWEGPDGEIYREFYVSYAVESYDVTTADGALSGTYTIDELIDVFGDAPGSHTDTSEWGVGVHEVQMSFMDSPMCTFEVEVVENPIQGFEVNMNPDFVLYEGSTMSLMSGVESYDVTLADGTVVNSEDLSEFTDLDHVYLNVYDDIPSDGYAVGDVATMTLKLFGRECTVSVPVVANPIANIELVFGRNLYDGAQNCEIWGEDGTVIYKEFAVMEAVSEIIVTTQEGETKSYDYEHQLYEEYGDFLYTETDQSEDNVWGVGTHTVSISFLGKNFNIEVEVLENPIIAFEPVVEGVLYEGNCEVREFWDDEAEEWIEDAGYYNTYELVEQFIVTTAAGSEALYEYEIYELYGTGVECSDDQSSENKWGIGKHEVTFSLMGKEAVVTVEVVKNLVTDLTINLGQTLYKGLISSVWDVYNSISNYIVTDDGVSSFYAGEWYLEEKYGDWVRPLYKDEDYVWNSGQHTVTFEFLGKNYDKIVKIVDNPIASIEVEGGTLYEGTQDSYFEYWENEEILYNEYSVRRAVGSITVTEKDGAVRIFDNISDLCKYYGTYIWYEDSFTSDQSSENEWGLGTHEATFTFLGVTDTFTVTIVENPVKSMELKLKDIYVHDCEMLEREDGTEYPFYHIPDYYDSLTLTFKDGTTETLSVEEAEEKYKADVAHDTEQWTTPWGLGTHTFEATFMGASCDVTANVVKEKVAVEVETTQTIETEEQKEALEAETTTVIHAIINDTVDETVVSAQTKENVVTAISEGKSIVTVIDVKELTDEEVAEIISDDVKAEMQEEAQKALSDNVQIQYLDVSALIVADEEEVLGTLHQLSEKTAITIAIPKELQKDNAVYKIIRNHNDEVTILDTINNGDGTITFETDCFSVYALAWDDGNGTDPNPDEPTPESDDTTSGSNNKDADSDVNDSKDNSNKTSPQTGDEGVFDVTTQVMLYMMIAMALIAVIVGKRLVARR